MHIEKLKDLAVGLSVLAIAIGGFLFVNPTGATVTKGVGGLTWRTLPFIYSGLLLFFALLYLGFTLFRGEQPLSEEEEVENELAARAAAIDAGTPNVDEALAEEAPTLFGFDLANARRLAVVGLLIAYSKAMGAFGFALSTPVFLFAVLYVFGKQKLVENLVVSLVGGAVLWLLFSHLLHMPLSGNVWDPVTPALNHSLKALGG